MSKITKTLDRVIRGNADANIRFADLCALLSHLGFVVRIRGDHHIFTREGVDEILNLQPRGDKAKAYQVKQVRSVLTAHGLAGMDEPDDSQPPAPTRTMPTRRMPMTNDIRYEIIIYWSKDDEAFIAEAPELPGCAADGATYQAAVANIEVVIREWIETAQELGRPIPLPRGRLLYA